MWTMTALLTVAMVAAPATPSGDADAEAVRAAARAYFRALTNGDPDAALAAVANPSRADKLVVRATAASARGLRGLEDLATSHFGARGDIGVAKRHRHLVEAIEAAPVEVKGDRATVVPQGERPTRLRRVNGKWMVESPADRLTAEEKKVVRRIEQQTDATTKDLAARIRSGAVKSAQELRDALRGALGRDDGDGVPL
jgi:hypothetical protein